MTGIEQLRPIERRVLRWVATGLPDDEIGRRFGHSAKWVAQVRFLTTLDRSHAKAPRHDRLRPLERRVLRWREQGADDHELSRRFRRGPDFFARVEEYADFKLATP